MTDFSNRNSLIQRFPFYPPYGAANQKRSGSAEYEKPVVHLPANDFIQQNLKESRFLLRNRIGRRAANLSFKRSSYRREKPAHAVARRNARERRRVQAVNQAFSRLRQHVPASSRGKRVSKVKTLRMAIDYIAYLQSVLIPSEHAYVSETCMNELIQFPGSQIFCTPAVDLSSMNVAPERSGHLTECSETLSPFIVNGTGFLDFEAFTSNFEQSGPSSVSGVSQPKLSVKYV